MPPQSEIEISLVSVFVMCNVKSLFLALEPETEARNGPQSPEVSRRGRDPTLNIKAV